MMAWRKVQYSTVRYIIRLVARVICHIQRQFRQPPSPRAQAIIPVNCIQSKRCEECSISQIPSQIFIIGKRTHVARHVLFVNEDELEVRRFEIPFLKDV